MNHKMILLLQKVDAEKQLITRENIEGNVKHRATESTSACILLLKRFRLVSRREALMSNDMEANKLKDKDTKIKKKEMMKWYYVFPIECTLTYSYLFPQCHAKRS